MVFDTRYRWAVLNSVESRQAILYYNDDTNTLYLYDVSTGFNIVLRTDADVCQFVVDEYNLTQVERKDFIGVRAELINLIRRHCLIKSKFDRILDGGQFTVWKWFIAPLEFSIHIRI
jgi:hypothetical protein